MLIFDAHLDLSWNALQWGRDLLRSAYTIRTMELATAGQGRAQGTVALPEMRRGRVALCLATILARSDGTVEPNLVFPNVTQAHATARGQLAYYRVLESQGHIRVISDKEALDGHVAEWQLWEQAAAPDATDTPPLGFIVSMESADPILGPDHLEEWWSLGLRVVGPAHYGYGRYAGGTGTEGGLTDLGGPLLDEMQRLGVILDVTHLSDPAFWQALERYDGPVLASHTNCRALVPHQRQFSDEMLRALFARDAVIGSVFDIWMLSPGWNHGVSTNANVKIDAVVDHIDHVCQLAGNSRHAAIGSDLDGGFGREGSPADLDTIADLQKMGERLAERGYSEEDISAIMYANWVRLVGEAWEIRNA
jgi:membrane dipeptidase